MQVLPKFCVFYRKTDTNLNHFLFTVQFHGNFAENHLPASCSLCAAAV